MPLILYVRVVPSSGKQTWVLERSGQLKCFLKQPAENGKANRELIKVLAKIFKLSQGDVTIATGAQARKKTINITTDSTYEQFLNRLGFEQQQLLL